MRALVGIAAAMTLAIGSFANAQDAKPVKIGVLEDLSGAYADITGKGTVTAAQLAVQDFGKTVIGRPIELLIADHQNKTDIGAAIARKWYNEDNVDMIVGLGNSSVALAVRELAKQNGKINIAASPGTTELTGKACSPTGFQWNNNNFAQANTIASSIVKAGGEKTFIVAPDYTFGKSLAENITKFTTRAGGKVVGQVFPPLGNTDFSSFILQAQSSGADNIALALAGGDVINFIKQSSEFGLSQSGQKMSAYSMFISDVKALGLNLTKGLYIAETYYWDMDEQTRTFGKRIQEKTGLMPNGLQVSTYSAVNHYLKSVQAAGTTDPVKVAEQMHKLPVNDFYSHNVRVREDGQLMRDYHLMKVKAPEDSHSEWDLLEKVSTIPNGAAYQTPAESECPLLPRP